MSSWSVELELRRVAQARGVGLRVVPCAGCLYVAARPDCGPYSCRPRGGQIHHSIRTRQERRRWPHLYLNLTPPSKLFRAFHIIVPGPRRVHDAGRARSNHRSTAKDSPFRIRVNKAPAGPRP